MYVEFVIADTSVVDGIPGLTSYATVTFLTFSTVGRKTEGMGPGPACPSILRRMDPGETDRPAASTVE